MTSLGLFQISPPDNVIDGAQLAQDDSQPNSRIDLSEEEQYGGHGISEHVANPKFISSLAFGMRPLEFLIEVMIFVV